MTKNSILLKLNILLVINIVIVYSLIVREEFQLNKNLHNSNNSSARIAQEFADNCREENSKEYCYVEQFRPLAKNNNLQTSINVLYDLQKIDQDARGCHLISHIISGTETEKDPTKWKQLIAEVPGTACTGGFIHGVLEAVASNDPDFYLDGKKVNELCIFIREVQEGSGMSNCAHIMGHILLAQEQGSISNATDVCDQVQPGMLYECYSGVFMENMTRDNLLAHGVSQKIPWNTDTIRAQEQICSLTKNNTSNQACWRELAHMYAYTTRNSPQEVYKLCQKAPLEQSAVDCYLHSVGIMSVSGAKIPGLHQNLCQPLKDKPTDHLKCVQWAIGSMLSSSVDFIDEVLLFCDNTPTTDQPACFKRIVTIINLQKLDESKNKEICDKINTHYKIQCP